jgi:hypothetical protein
MAHYNPHRNAHLQSYNTFFFNITLSFPYSHVTYTPNNQHRPKHHTPILTMWCICNCDTINEYYLHLILVSHTDHSLMLHTKRFTPNASHQTKTTHLNPKHLLTPLLTPYASNSPRSPYTPSFPTLLFTHININRLILFSPLSQRFPSLYHVIMIVIYIIAIYKRNISHFITLHYVICTHRESLFC